MQDQKIPIFWIKKKSQTQQRKIPILRCRYTAANYTIDVSFENVLTENTRIIHIKYVHLNCLHCIVFCLIKRPKNCKRFKQKSGDKYTYIKLY